LLTGRGYTFSGKNAVDPRFFAPTHVLWQLLSSTVPLGEHQWIAFQQICRNLFLI